MFGKLINVNPFALAERTGRPLILDGAMGSLLQQSGLKASGSMWMSKINIDNPEVVFNIHKKYINAGADIITANTFRTNPAAVEKSGLRINPKIMVKKSVQIALDAAKGLPVFIAGSNPPAEDCYKKKRDIPYKRLKENHRKHIDLLMESGVHFVLNETQSHFDEIRIISSYCSKNGIPYIMSLYTDENLKLLSGETLSHAVKFLSEFNPLAIGVNCIMPATFLNFYVKNSLKFLWGTYLNCGSGEFTDENISCGITPGEYGDIVSSILLKRPSFIGSCCGSSPEHTKKIKQILDEKISN